MPRVIPRDPVAGSGVTMQGVLQGIFQGGYTYVAANASAVIPATDVNKRITVVSAVAVVHTLPALSAVFVSGRCNWIRFYKWGAGSLQLSFAGTDAAADGAAGGNALNNQAGETWAFIEFEARSLTKWEVSASLGSWVVS